MQNGWSGYTFGAAGTDQGQDLYIDAKNQLFLSGSVQQSVDLNPTKSKAVLVSVGDSDGFVASFNLAGKFLGAARIGGAGSATAMGSVRSTGVIVAAVIFQGVVDLVPRSVPASATQLTPILIDGGANIKSTFVLIPPSLMGSA